MPAQTPRVLVGRRRRGDLLTLGHGLHVAPDTVLLERLAGWQRRLPPDCILTGLTAAEVYGLWLPPLPDRVPLFVAAAAETRIRRAEVRATRHRTSVDHVVVGVLRIATVPEVLLACARDLAVLDLVVMVDGALQQELCSAADLLDAASRGWAGSGRLREAVALADHRSESAWESLLRVLHTTSDVEVEPQFEVRDASGLFLARGDLRLSGTRTLHEYDGHHHRSREGQRTDLRRSRRLLTHSWERRGYVSEDVLHRGITILRDADATLGRDHRPGRLRTWSALLRDSMFTASGTARVVGRWNR